MPAALLLVSLSDPVVALWGLLIAQAGAILKSVLNRRSDRAEMRQKHEYEMELLRIGDCETRSYREQSLAKIAEVKAEVDKQAR